MTDAIKGLKPEPVWRFFSEIAEIPRESKNEARMTQYILDVAARHGLQAQRDDVGNVVVRKPAAPGKEKAPAVVLQGHLDMVCEKNKDKKFDFARDPIQLVRAGEYMQADGTTLGSDNGIGLAMSLAVMTDKSLPYGPLEMLCTVDEETGLTGANALKPDFVKGRMLLNLDSEEEGTVYVGCAGGKDTVGKFRPAWEEAPGGFVPMEVRITGLKGGHSGLDIALGRANSLKLLNRTLWNLGRNMELRLAKMAGGSKRNAIPREAEAVVLIPPDKTDAAKRIVAHFEKAFRNEFASVEPNLKLEIVDAAYPDGPAADPVSTIQLLNLLYALPHGVIAMSADIPDLVETSTNLAIIGLEEEEFVIATSQRSSVESSKQDIADRVAATLMLAGASAEHSGGYPGWKPNLNSRVLGIVKETYKERFGKEAAVKAIHAGLECGIIGEKFPGMDTVSMGPTIHGAHSPEERVSIDAVEKVWELVNGVLKKIAAG